MKKVIALVIALVMALSCAVIAFADTTTTSAETWTCPYCKQAFSNLSESEKKEHKDFCKSTTTGTATEAQTAKEYICPGCGKVYYNVYDYNECLASHNYGVDTHYWTYIGKTIPDIIDTLRNYFVGSQTQNLIFDVLYKLLDYFYAFLDARAAGGDTTEAQAGVNGAIADLDGILSGVDLSLPQFSGVSDLVNNLKQKIKDLYAGEIETTIEETVAEAPADTGSADVGIAVFAAVSIAAAAAFVCTKKKAD